MTIDEIEAELIAACEAKIAEGWTIAPGTTRDDEERRCCPMGAIASVTSLAVERLLGFRSYEFESGFVDGFDGNGPIGDSNAYRLGQKFRARYVTGAK